MSNQEELKEVLRDFIRSSQDSKINLLKGLMLTIQEVLISEGFSSQDYLDAFLVLIQDLEMPNPTLTDLEAIADKLSQN